MRDPNGKDLHFGRIERYLADCRDIYLIVVIATQTSLQDSIVATEWAVESFGLHLTHTPRCLSRVSDDLRTKPTRLPRADRAVSSSR